MVTQARSSRRALSAPDVAAAKGDGQPLVMVTAYDAPSARVVDAAGADMILVGDSLAMVVLGYDDTLQVTTEDMAHHVAAVARTKPRALIVGDLPWMSYHVSREETVRNAATLVRAGAGAVKLEGGRKRLDAIAAILDTEIPVMGHLGLTPQSVHALGGFRVQGRQLDAARRIVDDAVALAEAGCFAIVLECVPDGVARMVTDAVSVPTIGIGAGRHCDGQVLVYHDLLGLEDRKLPKFVRRYADLRTVASEAVAAFVEDVRTGRFPSSDETYHMTDQMAEALDLYGDGTPAAPGPVEAPVEAVTPDR
jgi:3-methyl-2-oxobutanoate hydroxymethyltransferase